MTVNTVVRLFPDRDDDDDDHHDDSKDCEEKASRLGVVFDPLGALVKAGAVEAVEWAVNSLVVVDSLAAALADVVVQVVQVVVALLAVGDRVVVTDDDGNEYWKQAFDFDPLQIDLDLDLDADCGDADYHYPYYSFPRLVMISYYSEDDDGDPLRETP